MRLPKFTGHQPPVAVNFGSSSIKVLQIDGGEKPAIIAAAELALPEEARSDLNTRQEFYASHLSGLLKSAGVRGKRAVCSVPSAQTLIQHMQLAGVTDANRDQSVQAELQISHNCLPGSVVTRSMDVTDVHVGGQAKRETICLAISRDTVMSYVDILKRCKLEVVGVHTELMAVVRAFDHINRREEDKNLTTMYVDLGWSGTLCGITHGREVVFARHIPIGGKAFDQQLAGERRCSESDARALRLAMSPEEALRPAVKQQVPVTAPTGGGVEERRSGHLPAELQQSLTPGEPQYGNQATGAVDFSELIEMIADELSMCHRYHQGLFPSRRIDRMVVLGGESRQSWLCQRLVKSLRIPAQLGDPLARYNAPASLKSPGLDRNRPQPGWAVVAGLCNAPTDL